MIQLYGFPTSRSTRISWMLEELNLEWEFKLVDLSTGGNRTNEFLSVNPAGKVPALKDGSLIMFESAAICLYLAEKYGKGKFLPPAGSELSGRHLQWISFIITELEQPLWSMGKHKFALPEPQRIQAMLTTAHWEFEQAIKLAEKMIPTEGYLLGEHPMVADILLGQTLNWANNFKQDLPPKAEAYRLRLNLRPALAQARDKEAKG